MQLIPMTVLLLTGLLFIYGTGQQIGGFYAELWGRQVVWIGIGAALWLTLSLFDYRNYGLLALCLYPVGLFLLIYVLFAGVEAERKQTVIPGSAFSRPKLPNC